MNSHTTPGFRKMLADLPVQLQEQAREAYRRFQRDPFQRGLRFRQVHPKRPVFSARINRDYRAVGIRDGEEIVWFWIGPHEQYETLLANL